MTAKPSDDIFLLAVKHLKGDGVEKNVATASKLFQAAAEAGHDKAQFNLGAMYLNGIGIVKNKPLAIYWLEKSASLGNRQALHSLEKIRSSVVVEGDLKSIPLNVNKSSAAVTNVVPDPKVENAKQTADVRKGQSLIKWGVVTISILGIFIYKHFADSNRNSQYETQSQNPMMQDPVYQYAYAITSQMSQQGACANVSRMILSIANSGSPDYVRKMQIDKIVDGRAGDMCIVN